MLRLTIDLLFYLGFSVNLAGRSTWRCCIMMVGHKFRAGLAAIAGKRKGMTVTTRAFRPSALAVISCCLLSTAIQAADSPSMITAAVDHAFRPGAA
jgi:hypothetical protein